MLTPKPGTERRRRRNGSTRPLRRQLSDGTVVGTGYSGHVRGSLACHSRRDLHTPAGGSARRDGRSGSRDTRARRGRGRGDVRSGGSKVGNSVSRGRSGKQNTCVIQTAPALVSGHSALPRRARDAAFGVIFYGSFTRAAQERRARSASGAEAAGSSSTRAACEFIGVIWGSA